MELLFCAEHPVFGSVANKVTAKEAFEMGKELAKSEEAPMP